MPVAMSRSPKRFFSHRRTLGGTMVYLVLLASIAGGIVATAEERSRESVRSVRPAESIAGPRELLAMLGLEDEFWAAWRDDQGLSDTEMSHLLRLLFLLDRFHPAEWELWQESSSWEELMRAPDAARGTIVGFPGRVASYGNLAVSSELLERFELPEVYVVEVALEGHPSRRVRLVVPRLPAAWGRVSAQGQPIFASGLCLKRLGGDSLLLLGPRVHWRPTRVSERLGVYPDHLPLVRNGFDFELLDDARRTNGRSIGQADRECFWKMLQATSRETKLIKTPVAAEGLFPLLEKPLAHVGRHVRVRGRTRRVARILVVDARDRRRLGFDAYYQIDLFIDLRGSEVIVRPAASKSHSEDAKTREPVVLRNVYPVTICTVRLPERLERVLGNDPSVNVRLPCEVDARLMKLWSYHSPLVARYGGASRQQVPLLIGGEFEFLEAPRSEKISLVFACLFLGGLGVAALWIWSTARADREARRRWRRRLAEDRDVE